MCTAAQAKVLEAKADEKAQQAIIKKQQKDAEKKKKKEEKEAASNRTKRTSRARMQQIRQMVHQATLARPGSGATRQCFRRRTPWSCARSPSSRTTRPSSRKMCNRLLPVLLARRSCPAFADLAKDCSGRFCRQDWPASHVGRF